MAGVTRGSELIGAIGGDDEDREVAGMPLHELEQLHRRGVGPLQVVYEERHRRGGGER